MFGYSMEEIGSIVVMQGFSGLSMFTVLLLIASGLALKQKDHQLKIL
jgi:urea transport system permease protein